MRESKSPVLPLHHGVETASPEIGRGTIAAFPKDARAGSQKIAGPKFGPCLLEGSHKLVQLLFHLSGVVTGDGLADFRDDQKPILLPYPVKCGAEGRV